MTLNHGCTLEPSKEIKCIYLSIWSSLVTQQQRIHLQCNRHRFYLWVRKISLGEGNGNPLQYFHLGNPMDRGAWWGPKSQTQLSD